VMADPLRLEQVLHNLLSNAVKYNRVGGWIEVRAAPAGNGTVRLEVADGGFGLTPEQQRQLFQPFNRLGRTDQDGTGIGLVICKQLVERMGGVIDVESDPGRGTVFGVSLASAPA
jgi:two-component system sensor histidine kinase EvgS